MDLSREEHRWYALIGAALAISAILLLVKQFTNDNARSNTIAPITPRHASHASTEAPRAERAPKPESAPKPTPAANPKPAPASQPKPKRAPAHRSPALPSGAWEATGVVVYVPPEVDSNQPEGAVLKRPWRFHRVCRGECRTVFARGTLYGPSLTTLVPHAKRFTASFPPVDVPCVYPRAYPGPRHRHGESHDSYILWWGPHNQLRAVEHRTETGCYPGTVPPDVTRWHSERLPHS